MWSKLVVINTTVCLFIYLFYFIIIIIIFIYLFIYLFFIIFFILFFFLGGGYIKLMFNYVSFINSVHTRISNLHQGLTPA